LNEFAQADCKIASVHTVSPLSELALVHPPPRQVLSRGYSSLFFLPLQGREMKKARTLCEYKERAREAKLHKVTAHDAE
jgi:hypothetical protein